MPNDDGLNVTYTFSTNIDSCLESLASNLVLIAQASRSIWQRSARAVPKHSSKSIWRTNTKSRFVINFRRNPLNVSVTLTNGMLIKANTFAACQSQIEICMETVVFCFVKHGCAGDWTCAECGGSNFARRNTCFKCDAPRYTLSPDINLLCTLLVTPMAKSRVAHFEEAYRVLQSVQSVSNTSSHNAQLWTCILQVPYKLILFHNSALPVLGDLVHFIQVLAWSGIHVISYRICNEILFIAFSGLLPV